MKKKCENKKVIFIDTELAGVVFECIKDTKEVFKYICNYDFKKKYQFLVENSDDLNINKFDVYKEKGNIYILTNVGSSEKRKIEISLSDIAIENNDIIIKKVMDSKEMVEDLFNIILKFIFLDQKHSFLFKKRKMDVVFQDVVTNNINDFIILNNVYELDKTRIYDQFVFNFVNEMKNKKNHYNYNELISNEEVNKVIKDKIGSEYQNEKLKLPFQNFIYEIENKVKLQCDVVEDCMRILVYSTYDKHLASVLLNLEKKEFNVSLTPKFIDYYKSSNAAYIISNLLDDFSAYLYFLNHYHVVKFKKLLNNTNTAQTTNNENQRYNYSKPNDFVIIPRKRYVCTTNEIKSARASKKPIYKVSEWQKIGYDRKYRDKITGEVIKKIFIEPQTCKRRKPLQVENIVKNKKYVAKNKKDIGDAILVD